MRIDKPTLMCDRCQHATEDLVEMSEFASIYRSTIGGRHDWDLCPSCYDSFHEFLNPVEVG